MTYTRSGAFKLNKDNFIVDNNGNFLQGFSVDAVTGENSSVSLSTTQPISIPTSAGAPRATNNIFLSMNVDSRELAPTLPFNPTDRASYNHSTSVTVYDSLGEAHIVTSYFRKLATTPPANSEWETFVVWDGATAHPTIPAPVAPATRNPASWFQGDNLTFDSNGNFVAATPAQTISLNFNELNLPANGYLTNGSQYLTDVVVNFRDASGVRTPTQYASTFDVNNLSQDGSTVGNLTGVDIDSFGRLLATYSNGDSSYLAQVAVVRFANNQGLKQVGNTSWKQSLTSGDPIGGQGNTGSFGTINSSALEQSNVNLTTELVDLISAQRNFQANSRALEVNSTLQQTILQIR
jgi:flagellar hook protein FlgE